jgi:hypothetical protein
MTSGAFLTWKRPTFLLLWILTAYRHCCESSRLVGRAAAAENHDAEDASIIARRAEQAGGLGESASSLRSVPLFCIETSRCQTLQMEDRVFSYVHISKTGGASWITELQSLLPAANVFPQTPTGAEHSVSFQNALNPFDFLSYHLVSLRSPRLHVWSLFTECKYDWWGKQVTKDTDFPRKGTTPADDVRDFGIWVHHFLSASSSSSTSIKKPIKTHSFGCYRAANYQTNALTGTSRYPGHAEDKRAVLEPDLAKSRQVYESMDWVALTDFFHESKCLLYHRLEPKTVQIAVYLETKCRCNCSSNNNANDENDDAAQTRRRRRRLYYDRNKVKTTTISIGDFTPNNQQHDSNRDTSKNQEEVPTATKETKNNNNTNSSSNNTSSNTTTGDEGEDVHATHHANGHRSSMLDLPVDILQAVDALTRVDQALYTLALQQFVREMAWLENKLGRRVLCDDVLEQWEPELAYLNVSMTNLYRDETIKNGGRSD